MHGEAIAAWQKAKELSGDNDGAKILAMHTLEMDLTKRCAQWLREDSNSLQEISSAAGMSPRFHSPASTPGWETSIRRSRGWRKPAKSANVFPLLLHADLSMTACESDPRFAPLLRRFSLPGGESTPLNAAGRITTETPARASISTEEPQGSQPQLTRNKPHSNRLSSQRPGDSCCAVD